MLLVVVVVVISNSSIVVVNILFFWDRVLLCSHAWPQTHTDSHASACKCWETQGLPGTADISRVSEQEFQAVINSIGKACLSGEWR